MVALIVPPSRRIPIEILLNSENELACTAIPTDEDAVESIVSGAGGNHSKDGSEEQDNSQDTTTEMERVCSVADLLAAIDRV